MRLLKEGYPRIIPFLLNCPITKRHALSNRVSQFKLDLIYIAFKTTLFLLVITYSRKSNKERNITSSTNSLSPVGNTKTITNYKDNMIMTYKLEAILVECILL